jgi:hypothetical protein
MDGVEFYRGHRSDVSRSRNNSLRYDEIGEINSSKDYHNKINGYHFYNGSNFNNASVMYGNSGNETAYKVS